MSAQKKSYEKNKIPTIKATVADQSFRTIKAMTEYTINLVMNNLAQEIYSNHPHFNYFSELLKRHPKFVNANPEMFLFKTKDPSMYRGERYRPFFREKDTAELQVFSLKLCFSMKHVSVKAQNLRRMRKVIEHDIAVHRRIIQDYCVICGETRFDLLEVDHVIPFAVLAEKFLSNFENTHELTSTNIEEWNRFHSKSCKLQTLCISCHRKKTATTVDDSINSFLEENFV